MTHLGEWPESKALQTPTSGEDVEQRNAYPALTMM